MSTTHPIIEAALTLPIALHPPHINFLPYTIPSLLTRLAAFTPAPASSNTFIALALRYFAATQTGVTSGSQSYCSHMRTVSKGGLKLQSEQGRCALA